MKTYKDYSYIKIIFDGFYEEGIIIYNNIIDEVNEQKMFTMFTAQVQGRSFNGSFADYKKQQMAHRKNILMDDETKLSIEEKAKRIESNVKTKGRRVTISSLK